MNMKIILLILYMICMFIVSMFAMYCFNKRDIEAIYTTIIISVFWPIIIPVVAAIAMFTKSGRETMKGICEKLFE